ncbi:MAG: class IV adenylate cyclase [Candidatus Magasanikbacteria bacterium]|nr:class IV adenylate cyclase [Candidatus Magasanikbacteria bacterium]
MEIEIRAKIKESNAINLVNKLKDLNAIFSQESRQIDIYFKHVSDIDRNLILRIRKTENGNQLTFKSKSKKHDTAWPDVDLELNEPDELESILKNNNYVEVVKIEKTRKTYMLNSFEINIDLIKDLGYFVEIEGRGNEDDRKQIEQKIEELLLKLGTSPTDIIKEGYVPLMIKSQTL